jgi:hypothetical protein
MLFSVNLLLVTNISGQHISPILKGQAVQKGYQEHLGVAEAWNHTN